MTDRLLLATLTLCVFVAGALTITSAVLDGALRAPMRVVQLEHVVVTGKRLALPANVATAAPAEIVSERQE